MHPVLFSIGDTPIPAYGFLIAVALILGWLSSLKFARDDKLPADLLGTNYVISVALGLIGGRAMWLSQNRDGSVADWLGELFLLEAGGLSGFGGVLVGLLVTVMLCQNKKIPAWAWLDCAAPAFLLGVVLERVAAFLAGTDAGHYVDPSFFLAVEFPPGSPVYEIQRRDLTGLRLSAEHSLPVHPSQLYAALAAAVGVALSLLIRARRQYSGQVALFVLGFYGVVRYVIEDSFRYDATPEVVGPLSLAQLTGGVLVAIVISAHVSRLAKATEDPSGYMQWTGGPWTPGAEQPKPPAAKKKSAKKKAPRPSGPETSTRPSGPDKSSAKPIDVDAKPAAAKPDAETKPD